MPVSKAGDKLKGVSERVSADRGVSRKCETPVDEAVSQPEEKKKMICGRQHNGQLLNSMLETYIRGIAEGDDEPRAARLVEELWRLAVTCEDNAVKLSAIKVIFERIDGKPVERKEVKSMKIEGIVYIPEAADYAEAEMGRE